MTAVAIALIIVFIVCFFSLLGCQCDWVLGRTAAYRILFIIISALRKSGSVSGGHLVVCTRSCE